MVRHVAAITTRATASTAANWGYLNLWHDTSYSYMHRRLPFNTMQCMSFSTADDNDTHNSLMDAQRGLLQSENQVDAVDGDHESIPFQRSSSKTERSNKNADGSGFDDRAQAKLAALSNAKKERIKELFSEACQRGLCSANVLAMFRNSVSKKDFHLTVGEGRLADHWIANITSPRALYTDGSTGGAGKNARRKGKSTSDWVKKKKVKESDRETKRKDKHAKQFWKKMKMGSA